MFICIFLVPSNIKCTFFFTKLNFFIGYKKRHEEVTNLQEEIDNKEKTIEELLKSNLFLSKCLDGLQHELKKWVKPVK